MFNQLIAENRVLFADKFASWQEAVAAAAQPLVRDGAIDASYIDAMIASILTHGPYIVIAPNVAMPHAQGGNSGVHQTAISFMRVKEPVAFSDSPEHAAQLLFVLASIDSENHLQMLQALVEAISEDGFLEELAEVENTDDLKRLLKN